MTTLVPDKRHPALEVPERERIDYLTVVASMAFADDTTDDREVERLREMCELLELGDAGIDEVLAAARGEGADLDEVFARLRDSELRFPLMVDALDIAYADDEIVPGEAEELRTLAEELDISQQQLGMLRRYVEARTGHEDREATEEANEKLAAGLAGAGIPVATLAVASAVGAPLLAGVGLAAALGLGSYKAVRWLFDRRG